MTRPRKLEKLRAETPELTAPMADPKAGLERHGQANVWGGFAETRPMVPSRLVKFSEIPIIKREAVIPGWPELNPHLRIVRPELMVIIGPRGDGKTQFATALWCNLAHHHNWPGAILQFEDDVERNREDLIRYWCGEHGITLTTIPGERGQYYRVHYEGAVLITRYAQF